MAMSLIDWFADRRKSQNAPISPEHQQREIADGLWTKCEECSALHYTKDVLENCLVCPACQHHNKVEGSQRIAQLIDHGSWSPINEHLQSMDPLHFEDIKPYAERLQQTVQKTGLTDGALTGFGLLKGHSIGLGVMDFRFMGGSMGSVVGEKFTRLIEQSTDRGVPVVLVCASGGARMQEGMFSLMQMAKISGALQQHQEARLLYIPVLTNPTTGGVTASFAMLGDIIIAEPKAMIGFAGRRVIEQTLRQKLPDDFQTAESLLKHGFVDQIVPRTKLKNTLAKLLRLHQRPPYQHELKASTESPLAPPVIPR
jgi:acetyl-CoA carboxylase carboxyl transferase subunit beta